MDPSSTRKVASLAALFLAAFFCKALPAEKPPATTSGTEALLKNVKAPAGFDVTLFAAPPEVSYPVCLAASPSGEVFIGIDENGSLGTKTNRGRILRCVDTDGDGRADQFKVFAHVDSPRGLFYDHGSLWVLHPPFLDVYHDDDGDGIADRSERLLEGLGFTLKTRGADHTINGIRMGIDGWIYIAAGDYGFVNAVGKDGARVKLLGGGVARVRPDGSELEIFADGLRNIYDVAVDPELDLFTRDNTNDGGGWDVRLSRIFSSAHYGYPSLFKNFSNEIVQPLADYGGGSPTGSLFLSEPGFPEGFGDTLYTCDWGRSIVYRHPLKRLGAGFSAQQLPFVEIARPTDMDVDGESRIYISSWKDGGFDFSKPGVGFVVRVTAANKGGPIAAIPNLEKSSDADLIKYLDQPSHVRRLHAQREILRRGENAGTAAALQNLARSHEPLAVRVAAIFTLKQMLGSKATDVLLALSADNSIKEFCLRALTDRKSQLANVSPGLFIDAVTHDDPRVRLQAVIGLGRLGGASGGETLIAATEDRDPLVQHAAVNALVSCKAIQACLGALDYRPSAWPGALRALQLLHDSQAVSGLVERLSKTTDSRLRRMILTALCRLNYREAEYTGNWWGTRPDTTGPYFKAVDWEETARISQLLSSLLKEADTDTKKFLLTQMGRHRIKSNESFPMLLKFAEEDNSFVPVAVDLLAAGGGLAAEAVPFFSRVAASAEVGAATRARAITALQRSSEPAALEAAAQGLVFAAQEARTAEELTRARESFVRDSHRAQSVRTFAEWSQRTDPARRELAYAVLMHLATQKQTSKEGKDIAMGALERGWSRTEDTTPLLKLAGQMRAEQFSYQVRAHLKDGDPQIRKQAQSAARELKLNNQDPENRISIETLAYERILAEAQKEKGDAKLGSQLFVRQGCVACHTISSAETPKGPFLGDIAVRVTRAEMIESILKPNAKVAQGFTSHWFEMTDGARYDGFIVRESGEEVEIRNAAGTPNVLATKEIVKRGKLDTSIMPEGLVSNLTLAELASLLSYLESMKPK
jgi:putative membrane-bound dehydrogenase-like protein